MERRLSAILVADIVGYSRLMEADEVDTIHRQKQHRSDVIDPAFTKHNGRIFKTTGDGFLVEFPSVVEAVNCAVSIQRTLATRDAAVPDDKRISYRIGINLGDVVHEGGDLHGDGVNVAARLEQMADPGGICISGTAYDHLRDTVSAGYEDMGEVAVKNIARPIRVWRVLLDIERAGEIVKARAKRPGLPALILAFAAVLLVGSVGFWWWAQRPDITPANPEKYAFELPENPSIAVLAFDNLSGDTTIDYVGDGLSESIIATLASEPKLFVMARNSTFHYKGTPTPIQTIAEELGVRFVLEGSVQQTGDKMRVTAQLIDALDGRHIWAKTYDRDLTVGDLFEIQDDIVQDIMVTMGEELISGEIVRTMFEDSGDMETFILNSQSISEYQKFSPAGNLNSEALALKALARNPNSGVANVNLGWVHMFKPYVGQSDDPAASLATARDYANSALMIDAKNPDALVLLAWLDLHVLDYESAVINAEKAISLRPGGGVLASLAGWVFIASGHPERGVELMKFGMRNQRFYPDWIPGFMAQGLRMLGQFDEAMGISEELAVNGNRTAKRFAEMQLAIHAVQDGNMQKAHDHVAKTLELWSATSIQSYNRSWYYVKDTEFLEHQIEALRAAGLPEAPTQ